MAQQIELGLDTFGDITAGPDGQPHSHAQVIRNVIEQGRAGRPGRRRLHSASASITAPISRFRRPKWCSRPSPDARSDRLGSAVTVLSSDDPIRVFQRFSTLNAASNGRAEVTLGRGSFIELFPLFGFELSDYEKLFEEKLDLFAALLQRSR